MTDAVLAILFMSLFMSIGIAVWNYSRWLDQLRKRTRGEEDDASCA